MSAHGRAQLFPERRQDGVGLGLHVWHALGDDNQRTFKRFHNVEHRNILGGPGQLVTATRPTHTGDQPTAPQLEQQLVEIGLWNTLALSSITAQVWTTLPMQREIQ